MSHSLTSNVKRTEVEKTEDERNVVRRPEEPQA